jgi:hypothetical protein
MSLDELIEEFYRVCYGNRANLRTVETPTTPQEMLVDDDSHASDWVRWKLIERSKVIVAEFAKFENEISYKLPESFKLWHSRYFTLDGDIGFVRLPAIPSNDPFKPLRKLMFEGWIPKQIADQGFLAFGSDGNDRGSLCFKTSAVVENADYPIYLWDHGWVGTNRELRLMFSSFRKLLECSVHHAGGKLIEHGTLPEGVKGFSFIDPEGAGTFFG